MTDVPIISITQDENIDDDNEFDYDASPRPSIGDCHTDIEDLDSDNSGVVNAMTSMLKKAAPTGAVTDIEDCEGSDDNEPDVNYGPEISLNDYLDQGCVDESSNIHQNGVKKSVKTRNRPFHLAIKQEPDGITDCEDLQASDDGEEREQVYSDDEKAIVLENSSSVDVHDSVNNPKKAVRKSAECRSASASSSDSETEKTRQRVKFHKNHQKHAPRYEDAKSDVENIFFSDEERRKSLQHCLVLETPDIEVMAFEGSDNEVPETPKFPDINISFLGIEKPRKKKSKRKNSAPSAMLGLPSNQDEGHTDVENLNSSDDDDDSQPSPSKPRNFIPLALIKCDALTDVEDFDDEASDCEFDDDDHPDVPLPSPRREMVILKETQSGDPKIESMPLPDHVLLGFNDLDMDKGLTDVEDFSDDNDDEDDDEGPSYAIDIMPEFEGGVVESSDHSNARAISSLNVSVTPEPITDNEEVSEKKPGCRRRKPKPKHSQPKPKSLFLNSNLYAEDEAGGVTDCEDLNVDEDDAILNDKSLKHRRRSSGRAQRTPPRRNADGKTDIEYMSGDDTLDLVRFSPDITCDFVFETSTATSSRETIDAKFGFELKLPQIRKPSLPLEYGTTDVEDDQCNSESEDADKTITPMELSRDLAELCSSQIHEINSGAFDRVRERYEIKENLCLVDSHTDIEILEGEEN